MKSKSNIIDGAETGQDKLLGEDTRALGFPHLYLSVRMEMKRVRSNLNARAGPNQSAVPLRVHPLREFSPGFSVCGLRSAAHDIEHRKL